MAVRFDASGESYTTQLEVPKPPCTILCWVKITTDRNTWSTFWDIDDGGDTNAAIFQTQSDGVLPYLDLPGTDINGSAMTVGTWYKTAVTWTGSTLTLYMAAAGASLAQVGTGTLSITPNVLRIGESIYGGEWLNGCLANFKHYSFVLTTAEMESELANYAVGLGSGGGTGGGGGGTIQEPFNEGNGSGGGGGT
jgi:hypothetical protein